MQISIVWWNTSLSPVAAHDRATEADQTVALQVIDLMIKELALDIICLGEVSDADIALIKSRCDIGDYSVYEAVSRVGRSKFDMCVLFRNATVFKIDNDEIVVCAGNSALKVGQRIDFGLADNETTLHLFVSHWPSRLHCDEHNSDRHTLGRALRGVVEKVLGRDHSGHAIVLGDFNDEPYCASLRDHLMASRDRTLAASKRHLLYNPFWRHMSPRTGAPDGVGGQPWLGGSYHYRKGRLTRWHTFDQIIFSSAFLGNSRWLIRDEMVSVLDIPPYTELVLDGKRKFDHMPVIATIERTDNNG